MKISPEVDNDPRAKYFEQAQNGLYIRMALLYLFTAPLIIKMVDTSGGKDELEHRKTKCFFKCLRSRLYANNIILPE